MKAFNLGLRVRTSGQRKSVPRSRPRTDSRHPNEAAWNYHSDRDATAVVLAEVPDIIRRQIRDAERAVAAANLQLIANDAQSLPETAVVIAQGTAASAPGQTRIGVTATIEGPPQTIVVRRLSVEDSRRRGSPSPIAGSLPAVDRTSIAIWCNRWRRNHPRPDSACPSALLSPLP